ncbi:MAG: hypothetical protein AAFZ92_00580 [Pseudomonadota bacterium]
MTAARYRIKPGMTGLAYIKGYRGQTATDDKMHQRAEYDSVQNTIESTSTTGRCAER